jgi:DNA replication protein DnaC
MMAKEFVKNYPLWTDGKGLLFTGGFGIGKTHLAVGILRKLIVEKGANGIFCDYRTLLKQIQDSYGRSDISERQVLAPIFDADVLVIDELGAAKPTDWVWDMVQHILNTRYNDRRTTIITTNYRNERELPMGYWDDLPRDKRDSVKAMYRDNLGDRITERMRSRLLEMCVTVEMKGADYRESAGRAEFGSGTRHLKNAPKDTDNNQQAPLYGEHEQIVSKLRIPRKDSLMSSRLTTAQGNDPSPPGARTSSLQSDRIWTQDDLDREVALKTASKAKRMERS